MTRSLQFRVPVEAPIGPKSSRVDVVRDILIMSLKTHSPIDM